MRKRIRFISWLIGVVLVSAAAILINPVGHILAQEVIPSHEHKEEMEDSQIIAPRAFQPISPRAVLRRGLFQSIQVNVDDNNNNIVGDAANEPSIAVDPTNPNNIVIGWRQFDTIASNFRQAGYAYSDDSGETWTFPGVLEPGQFRSDPVLAADTNGDIFYYSLSSFTSVEMFISRDNGLNWEGPIPSFGGDKAWMTIDTTGGIGNNHIYATWNSKFTCCAPGEDFTRSIDGGNSYQGPQALPEHPKWGTLDVGPDGELYIVGATPDNSSHLFLKSTNVQNAGQTPVFDLVTDIDLNGPSTKYGTPNPGGLMGQVWVAVDRSNLSTSGNVYVLSSVDPSGSDPLDVHFIRSTDGGSTWNAPIRINADPPGSNAWQWFATMSVSPEGRIDVVWNDTRNDPTGVNSELYYAYSTDAGNTWHELPVSPPFNSLVGHPNQKKIGDYYHMISDSAAGNLAWSATFNGEQDVYFLRVGDCNVNGLHDSLDIAADPSIDCNQNGFIDQCEETVDCIDIDKDTAKLLYSPVTPCRIVDTRKTSSGMIGALTERDFHVYGDGATISAQGGNSAGCSAPMDGPLATHINMIAVNPTGKGNLQAFPVGAGTGAGLSVNYNTIGTNLANSGTVKTVTGSGPDISLTSNFSSAHTVIDVLGYYYPAGDLLYTPVAPCRIVDTRKTGVMIGISTQRDFHVYGDGATISAQGGNSAGCSAPMDGPLATHINMIAVNPTGKGNLQAFPVGAGTGAGLSVNYNTIGTNLANSGTVKTVTGSGPDISLTSNFSSAHTVIDVLGYYYPAGDLLYTPVEPCRIVDTRRTPAGMIDTGTERDFRVSGPVADQGGNPAGCPSPLGEPLAAHINMVAVNPTGKGNLQALPDGVETGTGLSVNYNTIDTNLANAGTVKTSPDITVASNFSSAHAVIDVLGYYYPDL